MKRFALCALMLLAAGCATTLTIPGTYAFSGGVSGETLELRPEGTFHFEAWSDDGGVFFAAEGTWQHMASGEIETRVLRLLKGQTGPQTPLREFESWIVRPHSIIRRELPLQKRR